MPTPEGAAALAHVAGLDATEWLARATLWRSVGKPYEGVLQKALGGALRVTGGALASFLTAVGLGPLLAHKVASCCTMCIM